MTFYRVVLLLELLEGHSLSFFIFARHLWRPPLFFEKYGEISVFHSTNKQFEYGGKLVSTNMERLYFYFYCSFRPSGSSRHFHSSWHSKNAFSRLVYTAAAMIPWTVLFLLIGIQLEQHWKLIGDAAIVHKNRLRSSHLLSYVSILFLIYFSKNKNLEQFITKIFYFFYSRMIVFFCILFYHLHILLRQNRSDTINK